MRNFDDLDLDSVNTRLTVEEVDHFFDHGTEDQKEQLRRHLLQQATYILISKDVEKDEKIQALQKDVDFLLKKLTELVEIMAELDKKIDSGAKASVINGMFRA